MKQEYVYMALGDSLTVGFGAPEGLGFAEQFHSLLQTNLGKEVKLSNFGVNGATTNDLLELLRCDSQIRAFVEQSDVITITAGGNDLLRAAEQYFIDSSLKHLIAALKHCHLNYSQMIAILKQLKNNSPDPYMIRLAELYNPSPELKEAAFCIKRFNTILRKFKDKHIRVAYLYDAFLGREEELLHSDKVHPNERGYKVIANQFNRLGYSPLV